MTTSFANVQYPTTHPGVERATRAAQTFGAFFRNFDGGRATATLLLAAIVAALLVVANQLVETWTDGHLLAAWSAMWAVAFAGIALFAAPVRRLTAFLRKGLKAYYARQLQAHQDRLFWEAALNDARIMAEISRAMSASALRDIKQYY